MLLDRWFMQIMLRYINKENYLKIHMNFLKSTSKTIQFEAFHVFKIFWANPHKKPLVIHILYNNRLKMIKRTLFGRAKLDLLGQRFLMPAWWHSRHDDTLNGGNVARHWQRQLNLYHQKLPRTKLKAKQYPIYITTLWSGVILAMRVRHLAKAVI